MLEVEIKAKCGEIEPELLSLGAERRGVEDHVDTYFNPPDRDFKATDEALRVRCVNGVFRLTYKGPRIDPETKTREEIEVASEPDVVGILERLGFSPSGVVKKRRRVFRLDALTICLDEVEGLGSFIEVEASDVGSKEEMFSLFEKLGISRNESITKSYLELLEEQR